MAKIEAWLKDKLLKTPALAALHEKRVYPVIALIADKFPQTTYRRTGTQRDQTMDRGAVGIAQPTFEVRHWSTDYDEVKEMADATREAFDGFGPFRVVAFGIPFQVKSVFLVDESDDYEMSEIDENAVYFCAVLSLQMRHEETIPTFAR